MDHVDLLNSKNGGYSLNQQKCLCYLNAHMYLSIDEHTRVG